MRFLLDQNLSPVLVELLNGHGHDVVHVCDVDLSRADDSDVMAHAAAHDRVLISADTDFGEILARTEAELPSVPLLRRQTGRRAANLDTIDADLETGAIVVLDDLRIRVRPLPIERGG